MKRIIRSVCYMATILLIAGCEKNETEMGNVLVDGILIEVEAPRTNGWNTEENIGTRSEKIQTVKQQGKDGLDMETSIEPDLAATADKATTRWTNLDNNITFRVVAYKSATISKISTSNYVGYGDYKLSESTVQVVKALTVPAGTYTFVCYSYGDSNKITDFINSSTDVSVKNGQDFMTCIKPNITINNLGSKYILSDIVFKHQCVRYRVVAMAQPERMGNITACKGTVTLPYKTATYSFTNEVLTLQAAEETLDLTWSSPNNVNVFCNQIYLLPQSSANVTINLNLTIGGRAFTNKSITLPGLTFTARNMYFSKVSFTTTQGYIIRGAFWAGGNLYYDGSFKIYGEMHNFSTVKGQDFWRWGALYPANAYVGVFPWAQDPCRQVIPANSWRLPIISEYTSLLNGFTGYVSLGGKNGTYFDNMLFFPATGYYLPDGSYAILKRGLYWSSTGGQMLDFVIDNEYPPMINGSNHQDNYMTIRCVRAD